MNVRFPPSSTAMEVSSGIPWAPIVAGVRWELRADVASSQCRTLAHPSADKQKTTLTTLPLLTHV